MGVLGEINRSARVAWSPSGPVLAAGTLAGAIDASFETGARLELFRADLGRGRLSPIASVACSERFHRLAWAGGQAGLLAGGLDDGAVRIWDVHAMMRDQTTAAAGDELDPAPETTHVIYGGPTSRKRHSAAVRGLDFNPFTATLLASAAADSELLVWDLASRESPKVHAPSASVAGAGAAAAKSVAGGETTDLAWNRKVQHILAVTSSVGTTIVWDLRQKRPVISIRDPRGRTRSSALAWSPNVATQLMVASDDDSSKAILLWDLRNAQSPIREYTHHHAGVLSLAWCPQDSEMVLTTGKDSRTCIISASTGDMLCEMPRGANWNFDLHWSPHIPGLFSTSSFDGRLAVHGVLSPAATAAPSFSTASAIADSFQIDATEVTATSPRLGSGNISDLNRPPLWLKRCSGCAFGFGGQVIRFTKAQKDRVEVVPVVTEPDFVHSSEDLEEKLATASPEDLRAYCEVLAKTESDSFAWEILKTQFEVDARRKLLKLLGFIPPENKSSEPETAVGLELARPLAQRFVLEVDKEEESSHAQEKAKSLPSAPPLSTLSESELSGPAPWDTAEEPNEANTNGWNDEDTKPDVPQDEKPPTEALDKDAISGEELETFLKRAIMLGDFASAVARCLEADRTADALMLAHCGGPTLWNKTQETLLADNSLQCMRRQFRSLVSPGTFGIDSMAKKDIEEESFWKDSLATIVSYNPGPEFIQNCDIVGSRLMLEDKIAGALCFFLCSFNVKLAAHIWMKDAPDLAKSSSPWNQRLSKLMLLAKKIRVLSTAAAMTRGEADVAQISTDDNVVASVYFEMGALLASQGRLQSALHYVGTLAEDVKGPFGTAGDLTDRLRKNLGASPPRGINTPSRQQSTEHRSRQTSTPTPEPAVPAYTTAATTLPPATNPFHVQPSNSFVTGTYASQPGVPSIPYSQPPTAQPVYTTFTPQAPSAALAGPPPPPPTKSELQSRVAAHTAPPPVIPQPQLMPVTPPGPTPVAPGASGASPAGMMAPPPPPAAFSQPSPVAAPKVPQPAAPAVADPNEQFMMPSAAEPSTQPPTFQFKPPAVVGASAATTPLAPPLPQVAAGPDLVPPPVTIAPGQPVVSASVEALTAARASVTRPDALPAPSQPALPATSPAYRPRPTAGGPVLPETAEIAGVVKMKRTTPSATPAKEPPVSIADADVSNVPGDQQVIVNMLRSTFSHVCKLNPSPVYRRKMDDVDKRLGRLLARLNSKELDSSVIAKLQALCEALNNGDHDATAAVVSKLSRENWDDHSYWIVGVKRLTESAKTGK